MREDCRSLSYTYTEPAIFFEYAYDVAKIAKKHKLRNIFVTNGYIKEEPLRKIAPYLDAVNIDLKFFKESSYKKFCNASLSAVLESIRLFKSLCLWIEITTLVIPGVNDSKGELKEIADFIAGLDINIPWHISRFYPNYQLADYPITPEERLKEAQGIGLEAGVRFVYAGNVRGWGEDTLCPYCYKVLIKRDGFRIEEYNIASGNCKFCQGIIPGVFLCRIIMKIINPQNVLFLILIIQSPHAMYLIACCRYSRVITFGLGLKKLGVREDRFAKCLKDQLRGMTMTRASLNKYLSK